MKGDKNWLETSYILTNALVRFPIPCQGEKKKNPYIFPIMISGSLYFIDQAYVPNNPPSHTPPPPQKKKKINSLRNGGRLLSRLSVSCFLRFLNW